MRGKQADKKKETKMEERTSRKNQRKRLDREKR